MKRRALISRNMDTHSLFGVALHGVVVENSEDGFILMMTGGKDLTGEVPKVLQVEFKVPSNQFPRETGDVMAVMLSCHPKSIYVEPPEDDENVLPTG